MESGEAARWWHHPIISRSVVLIIQSTFTVPHRNHGKKKSSYCNDLATECKLGTSSKAVGADKVC